MLAWFRQQDLVQLKFLNVPKGHVERDASAHRIEPIYLASLQKLTERYCVVYQTLASGVTPEVEFRT